MKSTFNTRELGGYRTKDGGITRYHSLLRSDALAVTYKELSLNIFECDITPEIGNISPFIREKIRKY